KIRLKKNPETKNIARKFGQLADVMFTLRSEQGCPWDRAQSLDDLKQYLLEETYEVLDTLDRRDETHLLEELGDLLFQIVFLSQMMQEKRAFTLSDVLDHLLAKMIGRHPHVFADVKASTPDQALASWEGMKGKEASAKGKRRGLLAGVPQNLPALLQANLISSKVARVGFDWKNEKDVWKKLEEEFREFRHARNGRARESEMGDILFTMVNIARKNKINPEDALRKANAKFRRRFNALESHVARTGKTVSSTDAKSLDSIWNRVKKK